MKNKDKLISQGWKKKEPIENLPKSIIDKRSEWSKSFLYTPIIFSTAGAYTTYCVGMIYFDQILKELHVIHLKEESFQNRLEIKDKSNFSIQWVVSEITKKRIKRHREFNKLFEGDSYFGKGSLGSSFYVLTTSFCIMLTKPDNLIEEMVDRFSCDSLFDIDINDCIYFKIENIKG